MYLISQLASAAGVNIETIRYYQRLKLIALPQKPLVGFRRYPETALNRLRFIRRAQELGFTLKEIANLLSLSDRPCGQVQELATQKLNAIKEKVADLHRLELALDTLVKQCQNNEDDNHCPIIDSLQP
jgi:MerR family mercuric resistance operon transcriptional regulator